ncbi:MAG: hypothetical protein U9O54_03240 [Chloroflexota bacterium]|nr:hypothetical protein [Chloroflexota bacterium]
MPEIYITLSVGLVFLTALSLLLFENWRWNVGALTLQYLSVFVLVAMSSSTEIAVVKLVAGWMSVAILGMALVDYSDETEQKDTLNMPGKLFRGLTAVLVGLVVISFLSKALTLFVGAAPQQILGGLFLLGLGLLHISLSASPIRVVIGLLTITAGFGILYASVEESIFVTTLLAIVNLGIAFVGAYFLSVSSMEVIE